MYLILFVIIIVFVIVLPQLSGIATVKIQPKRTFKASDDQDEPVTTEYQGYVPPDEQKRIEEQRLANAKRKSTLNTLKSFKNISKDDIPLKFKLNDNTGTQLRKRGANPVARKDSNPTNFDYDLDELIDEELQNDERDRISENERKYYKGDVDELA